MWTGPAAPPADVLHTPGKSDGACSRWKSAYFSAVSWSRRSIWADCLGLVGRQEAARVCWLNIAADQLQWLQGADAVGAADWATALEPLLAVQPATGDDIHLWLHLLPLLQTLLSMHRLQPAQLQWLAFKVKMAALPLLSSPEAGAAAPLLPLTLSDHPAAHTFEGVLEAMDRLRLILVRLRLLCSALQQT